MIASFEAVAKSSPPPVNPRPSPSPTPPNGGGPHPEDGIAMLAENYPTPPPTPPPENKKGVVDSTINPVDNVNMLRPPRSRSPSPTRAKGFGILPVALPRPQPPPSPPPTPPPSSRRYEIDPVGLSRFDGSREDPLPIWGFHPHEVKAC